MCDYCGCLNDDVIEQLTDEHLAITATAERLAASHRQGDRSAVRQLAAQLADQLGQHVAVEEGALFAELEHAGVATHTTALTDEHRELDAVFGAAARGDDDAYAALPTALQQLSSHIWREDYDLFPASLQLLSADGWSRTARAAARLRAAAG